MRFFTKKFLSLSLACASHQGQIHAVENSNSEVDTEGYGIIRTEYLEQAQKEVPYYDLKIDTQE